MIYVFNGCSCLFAEIRQSIMSLLQICYIYDYGDKTKDHNFLYKKLNARC